MLNKAKNNNYLIVKNKNIVPKESNFSAWYSSIINEAKLALYTSVKGSIIFLPNAWLIWQLIKKKIDDEFKKIGVKNVQLPTFINANDFMKEVKHIGGFAPETFTVSTCLPNPSKLLSNNDSQITSEFIASKQNTSFHDSIIIRPTSEVIFCDCFKKILNSYNDLPILYNQWCNVFRNEKNTRPFLRTNEFYWQELHTIHQTEQEAITQAIKTIKIYKKILKNELCMPFIYGEKTINDRFAGAIKTFTLESLMPDGQALQCCTSHYLGQNFAKAYDIKYQNQNNQFDYVYQTSAGLSTRIIGGLIMTHSDNNGLVLPLNLAPIQIAIIPLEKNNLQINNCVKNILKNIKNKYRVEIDDSDKGLGYKINNYQVQGTVFIILIGKNEIQKNVLTIIQRNQHEKIEINPNNLKHFLKENGKNYQKQLYEKAKCFFESSIVKVNNFDEFKQAINQHKFVEAKFKQSTKNEEEIKKLTGATARCIKHKAKKNDKCFFSNEQATDIVYFARSY